jgi:ribosome-binding protein aMBF1 (putative translation factor)
LTQDEFALKLSVNSAVLKAAESGRRLDMPTARRIEKALKIKLIENI